MIGELKIKVNRSDLFYDTIVTSHYTKLYIKPYILHIERCIAPYPPNLAALSTLFKERQEMASAIVNNTNLGVLVCLNRFNHGREIFAQKETLAYTVFRRHYSSMNKEG